jgi:Txe/YoeB family toxin of toxin-antitoxin system
VYQIHYTKKAVSDISKLKAAGLDGKAKNLVAIVEGNPYQNPPRYEKLHGFLSGLYSRRINIQHRMVYQVLEAEKAVKIISMWSHYDF